MSEFINTIAVLGDEATMDAIIERTITDFIDDTITSIGSAAFCQCASLKSIYVPNAIALKGNNQFAKCTSLTKVVFESLENLGSNQAVFEACTSLTTVDFWTVTKLCAWKMFYNCSNLTALILRVATVATNHESNALIGTPIASGTGYIYVPRDLVDSYKAATNWSTYADQFRALEDYTVDGTITGELDETKI